jgi:hypothetical protein
MLFGHNSNVKVGDAVYHVQTEDRGASHAVIDTMVYHSGRVLHRRANSYADLLPLDAGREQALKERVSTQHHAVLEELRSGALKFAQQVPAAVSPPASESLMVELLNAKSWLAGKRATLQIFVSRKGDGAAVSGARVTARIDGAAEPSEYSTATGTDGKAQLAFDMPRLAAAECALVIEGYNGKSQARLQFQLRAKPRIPAAG